MFMGASSIPPPNSQPVGQEKINPTSQTTQISTGPTASAAILASTMEGASKAIDPIVAAAAGAVAPTQQTNTSLKQTDPLSPKNKAQAHELYDGGNPKDGKETPTDNV